MSNMQVFNYVDSEPKRLRVLVVEGAPWLVLSDLCKILCSSNTTQLARSLPESMRRYVWLCERYSRLECIVISEKGLNTILYRYASKPGVDRITKWIRQDVLPCIVRKGGFPASILHKKYESRRKASATQPEEKPIIKTTQREEKLAAFVMPVTKIVDSKPIAEYELFDLWQVEMFLRIAKMKGLTEYLRMWAIDSALREVRKQKPLDSSDPKILELPEVVGQMSQRVKHTCRNTSEIVLNPVRQVAKHVGVSIQALNAFAESEDWKKNGVDGFWVEVKTKAGKAREFMYTEETMNLLSEEATQIHKFEEGSAA